MQYGTVATGGSQVRRHVRPHVLHSEVRPAGQIHPSSSILNWKGDPKRAFQTLKSSKGRPLRLAARWTARHYAIGVSPRSERTDWLEHRQ